MSFTFGPRSLAELKGVHPVMVRFAELTLAGCTQDFAVHDGLRTKDEQRALVAAGASQTLNSKHLPQADGFGHAVDLVPYINGKLRWEWPPIYVIASAAWRAAQQIEQPIRWGGCWQNLRDIPGGTPAHMAAAVERYGAQRRKAGKKAFMDGPHMELNL